MDPTAIPAMDPADSCAGLADWVEGEDGVAVGLCELVPDADEDGSSAVELESEVGVVEVVADVALLAGRSVVAVVAVVSDVNVVGTGADVGVVRVNNTSDVELIVVGISAILDGLKRQTSVWSRRLFRPLHET